MEYKSRKRHYFIIYENNNTVIITKRAETQYFMKNMAELKMRLIYSLSGSYILLYPNIYI